MFDESMALETMSMWCAKWWYCSVTVLGWEVTKFKIPETIFLRYLGQILMDFSFQYVFLKLFPIPLNSAIVTINQWNLKTVWSKIWLVLGIFQALLGEIKFPYHTIRPSLKSFEPSPVKFGVSAQPPTYLLTLGFPRIYTNKFPFSIYH